MARFGTEHFVLAQSDTLLPRKQQSRQPPSNRTFPVIDESKLAEIITICADVGMAVPADAMITGSRRCP